MSGDFAHAYLYAWVFWMCLTLGCFAMTLLHGVLRGRWGLPILRVFEAGAKNLPLIFLLGLPILFSLPSIYPWAAPHAAEHDAILQHKAPYLNSTGWIIRYVVFFAIWTLIAGLLARWSQQQDVSRDPALEQKRSNLAAPGIVIFFLTVTFAITDWVMSLDPHWMSTIYGVIFAVGMALAGVSFATMMLIRSTDPAVRACISPALLRDLGNLMLAMCMFWAYVNLSQYLIIWSANLPEEITFFKARSGSGWQIIGFVLFLGQFFVPFIALLATKTKKVPSNLFAIAALIFAMRFVDVYWNVMPTLRGTAMVNPLDIVVLVAMGALWLGLYRYHLSRAERLPQYDPRLREATDHA
jgi:hypothetical protein